MFRERGSRRAESSRRQKNPRHGGQTRRDWNGDDCRRDEPVRDAVCRPVLSRGDRDDGCAAPARPAQHARKRKACRQHGGTPGRPAGWARWATLAHRLTEPVRHDTPPGEPKARTGRNGTASAATARRTNSRSAHKTRLFIFVTSIFTTAAGVRFQSRLQPCVDILIRRRPDRRPSGRLTDSVR